MIHSSFSRARVACARQGLGQLTRAWVPGVAGSPHGFARSFAFNIWDEQPKAESKYAGTPQEVAEKIFLMHAMEGLAGGIIPSGQTFKAACATLANEYPELSAIENVALEGRLFELFDQSGDGVVDRDEWVEGVQEILNPSNSKFKNLKERLEAGFVNQVDVNFEHVKRVAIVGAGVAGLQTARALAKRGKEVVIFEKSNNVGGVWKANYADFGLQVPKELYEFPEYPYPSGENWEKFPPGPQVQKYIELYAQQFGLLDMVRFDTGVYQINTKGASGERGWKIQFGKQGASPVEEDFDFVVVATGMYGWPPHIPTVRNDNAFKGEVFHSQTFQDKEVAKGKKVVVVGGGKSAIDNVVSSARVGKSATLVYRSAHWPVPRYLCNLVPFKWGTYSRFGHFMLTPHYETSKIAWYFHGVLAPVKWVWWRIVELMFRVQFQLPKEMIPSTPIEIDVFTGGQILNYNFRDMLKSGQVKAIRGSLSKFTENGVVLQDGTELEADMVIFGTGFTKSYDLFDRLVQNKLDRSKDGLYLYRNVIPPRLPDIAFVGSEVSTFNNILTHSLQSEWLARVLDGKIILPTSGRMLKTLELEQAWKRTWMPATSARASIFQLHMMKYHDQLVKDMGESHKRKGANVLAEMFAPYCAADYRPLFQQ
eukprot:gnl/MRDRNA2_/MRDRNA2_27489_c0_seq1.p1 gnl/MRDRNA2_/MRDRNA2_27489_c0~~gnl/MRDRNA2_/MRDRNA2_27489_c0_seq1.p1  ORF type:complete len:651 (+),score=119.93 gnl/MRDRNA2_/MRDRNA2_27489_c0_seq1:90-2042(+)